MESWGPSVEQTASAEEIVTVAPRRRWCYRWEPSWASAPTSDTGEDIVRVSRRISLGLEKVGSCRPRQFYRGLPCGPPISILNSLSRTDLLIFILHFLSCSIFLKSLLNLLQYCFCFIFEGFGCMWDGILTPCPERQVLTTGRPRKPSCSSVSISPDPKSEICRSSADEACSLLSQDQQPPKSHPPLLLIPLLSQSYTYAVAVAASSDSQLYAFNHYAVMFMIQNKH